MCKTSEIFRGRAKDWIKESWVGMTMKEMKEVEIKRTQLYVNKLQIR